MAKKNKVHQKEGGGFIKKVSSLFNLDTVNLSFIFFYFSFPVIRFNLPITLITYPWLTQRKIASSSELLTELTALFVFDFLLILWANRFEWQHGTENIFTDF